jgi:hypothetical protein
MLFGNVKNDEDSLLIRECLNLFYKTYPEQKNIEKILDKEFQDYF